jgi:hypothetical protein
MSHWAKIENEIVTQVTTGSNEDSDEGYQWLINNLGGTWIQTSYNTRGGVHVLGGVPLHKNYAGIGFTYDSTRDAFIPPKPEPIVKNGVSTEWILNEETCLWENSAMQPAQQI